MQNRPPPDGPRRVAYEQAVGNGYGGGAGRDRATFERRRIRIEHALSHVQVDRTTPDANSAAIL